MFAAQNGWFATESWLELLKSSSHPNSARSPEKCATFSSSSFMADSDRQGQTQRDAELLQKSAGGDEDAFSELYDRFSRPLYTLAYQMLGDESDAKDVVQELFVRLWERAYAFDPTRGSAFSWAVGMMRLRIIDRIRARHRRMRLLEKASHEPQNSMFGDTPQQLRVDIQRNGAPSSPDDLQSIIKTLTPEQKEVIELAFFQGLTHPEIAERLHAPLGTIKARIRRGLSRLRDQLRDIV